MRFKKGDKVEVMNDQDAPVSWHSAEILSSYGHTYTVRYDFYHGRTTDIERVSTDSVRPRPPLLPRVDTLDVGDVVEVFHEFSWKIAAIVKVMSVQRDNGRIKAYKLAASLQSRYLVKLLGSSLQLIVGMSNIRTRRTWHDGTWILMEKNIRAASYLTATKTPNLDDHQEMNYRLPQSNSKTKNIATKGYASIYNDASPWGPTEISQKSRKRVSPYDPSAADLDSRHVPKLRIVQKHGLKQIVAGVAPRPIQVHDVPYPREILVEKNMHASTNIISSNRYNQTEKATHGNHIRYSGVRSFELCTDDNDTSSVGSCSVNSQGMMTCCYERPITAMCGGVDADAICSDDAESRCGSESETENSLPPPKTLEVSIRWLELHAYRSTLEALYVSGPLTWEQERLLTDLRMMLHISNDEHLKELKQLISTK